MTNTTRVKFTEMGPAKKFTETKVLAKDLKAGDVFWFSGFWCTFTRFDGLKVMARFPYTPADRDVWMFQLRTPAEDAQLSPKWGPQQVTVRTAL